MSAITYPAVGRRSHLPAAPSPTGLRRRLASLRPRRFDDRPGVERNTSPSELALRPISGVAGVIR